MICTLRRLLPLFAVTALAACASANAQFYKPHNADIALGGTGQFTTILTSNGNPTFGSDQQYTTWSAGFIGSLRDHPVAWAGIELNYGFTRFSEIYNYSQPNSRALFSEQMPTSVHEGTAAYMFHPNFFHLQPFVNIGGGSLFFNPRTGPYQWRGTGLLEEGFDIPTSNRRIGFRIQNRSLVYRAPNFNNPLISTRSWVVTNEPSLSVDLRF